MNLEHRDIEAYVKTDDASAVVSLLSRSIGPLTSSAAPEDDPQIYQRENVSVVLWRSEDGFLSVSVQGTTAWSSCAVLGRHLAKELRCVVRCDPENEFPEISPYSNVFLEIEEDREILVSWG